MPSFDRAAKRAARGLQAAAMMALISLLGGLALPSTRPASKRRVDQLERGGGVYHEVELMDVIVFYRIV